jgi:hypothetical protein
MTTPAMPLSVQYGETRQAYHFPAGFCGVIDAFVT